MRRTIGRPRCGTQSFVDNYAVTMLNYVLLNWRLGVLCVAKRSCRRSRRLCWLRLSVSTYASTDGGEPWGHGGGSQAATGSMHPGTVSAVCRIHSNVSVLLWEVRVPCHRPASSSGKCYSMFRVITVPVIPMKFVVPVLSTRLFLRLHLPVVVREPVMTLLTTDPSPVLILLKA